MKRILTVAALLLLPTLASHGAPIAYDESVDGDLATTGVTGSSLATFTFDLGANTIAGNMGNDAGELDAFAFIVPAGMEITAGGVTSSDATGDYQFVTWELRRGGSTYRGGNTHEFFTVNSPGAAAFVNVPYAAHAYNISPFNLSAGGANPTTNYIFTFNVASVPEPASLGLLALGSVMLLCRRR